MPRLSFLSGLIVGGTLGLAAALLLHRSAAPAPSAETSRGRTPVSAVEAPSPPLSSGTSEASATAAAPASVLATTATSRDDDASAQAEALVRQRLPGTRLGDDRAVADALRTWAADDPLGALEFVLQTPRLPRRLQTLAVPLAELTRLDPLAATAWMKAHLDARDLPEAAESTLHLLVDRAPAAGLELAFAPGIAVDAEGFGRLIGSLATTDPAAAAAAFARLSEDGCARSAAAITTAWGRQNLAAATQWALAQHDTPYARGAREGILQAAFETHPTQLPALAAQLHAELYEVFGLARAIAVKGDFLSFDLVAALPEGDRAHLATSIAAELIDRSPEETLAALRDVLPTGQVASALSAALDEWRESDRPAADAWLAALPDAVLREAVTEVELLATLRGDPAALLRYHGARGTTPDPEDFGTAVARATRLDPAATAAWLTTLPVELAHEHVADVAYHWLEQDEVAAARWIDGLPASPGRDRTLAVAAAYWSRQDEPEAAFTALAAIDNPQQRLAASYDLYRALRTSAPTTAEQWLARQNFSEETKHVLRSITPDTGSMGGVHLLPFRY